MTSKHRHFTALLLLLFFGFKGHAQVTVWSDNFNNGCTNDCIANTWNGWTIQDNVGGTTGGSPNNWFVSCAEEGIAPPGCGSSCIGDASLHIGANPGAGGDMGATFNETGATNATFRRAVSPTISTVGYSTNTLLFDFIAYGSAACSDDRAQLHLSTDNGATWPVGFQYCLNSVCCGACNGYSQGQWTLYTLALPAAFDNNPNVRVGFHWRNNGNGSGTDPSVAIDDVRITTAALPVTMVQFQGSVKNQKAKLQWTTASESNLNAYEVERSFGNNYFVKIGNVTPKGTPGGFTNYTFDDPELMTGDVYYRLRMVDDNGNFSFSNIVKLNPSNNEPVQITSVSPKSGEGKVTVQLFSNLEFKGNVDVLDALGKTVVSISGQDFITGNNSLTLNTYSLAAGTYFVRLYSTQVPKGYNSVSLIQKFVYGTN